MKLRLAMISSLCLAALVGCGGDEAPTESPTTEETAAEEEPAMSFQPDAPDAPEKPYEIETHGDVRIDPYFWLRDDEREDPDVLAYLEAENSYLDQVLDPAADLRETLYEEMVGRLKQDDSSVPAKIGDYWYYSRYDEGLEYPIFARRKGSAEGPEEIVINANERAEGHEYYALGNLEMSDDHKLAAFAEDTVSRRLYTVRVKNMETGELLDDVIEDTSGALAWSADGQYLFYVKKDTETLLPYQVYRHKLGTPVGEDVLVYEEADSTFYTSMYRGKSNDYIYIHLGQTVTDEVRLIPADQPTAEPIVFLPRERGHEYRVEDIDGRFYVLTNWDAVNFRLMQTNLENSANRAAWTEVVPHRDDVFIHDIDLFRDFLVVNERREGLRRMHVMPFGDGEAFDISSDEPAYAMYFDDNYEVDTDVLRYVYTSLTTPDTVYDFNMKTGERTLLKRDPVLGEFDPADYRSERFMVAARDGVQVPVSLVYKVPFEAKGTRPLLVYGYGSYGSTVDPSFSIARLSLLDRGFVFAIAHIRGSQALGRQWYEDGKMFNKINTFTDFIDVTKGLVDKGYGDPERVYAYGGSAGGLLMGAVANMAPQLYHGIVAAVPFVDVVTTMLDESIPLTTGEFDEWGNPKIKDQYEYMLSYSPYDQVTEQDYPNILVTTGLHDSQVQYWEPAKWVAKLRDMKTDDNLLLMYTDMSSGHGGASGRFKRYEDIALRYGFLIWLAGAEG